MSKDHSKPNSGVVKMGDKDRVAYTTIVNKYPSFRDDAIKGCWKWLKGRRADDNAEGLWRVHDKLYDLTDFVEKHPGGSNWLTLTKGTDITEAFESYHITNKAPQVLVQFYVRDAAAPRNYKITYEDDGFYRTLKRRVAKKLKTVDRSVERQSKIVLDFVVAFLFLTSILAMRLENIYARIAMILMSGQLIGWLNTVSHNFIHQPNNWRMYTANLVLTGWRDWRVYHGLSHHLYPNSYTDFEISSYEPFFRWIPIQEKTNFSVMFSYLATPFVYGALFHSAFLLRTFGLFFSKTQKLYWDDFIPLLLPMAMFLFGNSSLTFMNILSILIIWNVIIIIGAFTYSVIAVNAGHHGPEITHEGDEMKGLDYGIFQLGATIDRVEASSNLFVSLTHFGHHILHHMFPSLDHSILPQLNEVFIETCMEFKGDPRDCTMLDAVIAQFQQLSRTDTIKIK